MITEHDEELACLYALGAMSPEEKAEFEMSFATRPKLQQYAEELAEIALSAITASLPAVEPPPHLRAKIVRHVLPPTEHFHVIEAVLQTTTDPIVVTTADGLVEWVNPAFEKMCGYGLEEVIGQKPGKMLQGEKTDREAVARISLAIREARPCTEELINYRKNGEPYWVAISISPILDAHRQPRCFIAMEHELTERAVA